MHAPPRRPPRRRDLAWLAAALAVTAASLGLRLLWVSAISDDGLTLANAAAVAAGQVPYRDFFLASPPGVVALYGLLFKLTGIAYLPARLLTAAAVLLSVAALWDAARRLGPPGLVAFAAALYGSLTATFLFSQPHHFWSMTLPYAMAWALVRGLESPRRVAWSAAAGVLGGAALLSDQTSAVPVLAGLAAAWFYAGLRRSALPFLAGVAAVSALTLGWIFGAGLFAAVWREAVVYPSTTFLGLTPVPAPYLPAWVVDLGPPVYRTLPLERLVVWLAGAVGDIAVCAAGVAAIARLWRPAPAAGMLVLAAAGVGLSVLLARPTGPFLWMGAGLNLVLLAALAARPRSRVVPALTAALLAFLAALPLPQGIQDGCGPGGAGVRVPVAAQGSEVCVESSEAGSLGPAVAFGRAHRAEGVAYLAIIAPGYTLAGEAPPVGYAWVAPDVLTETDLARLEEQLASRRVGWIVSAPRIASAGLHPGSPETTADGRWVLDAYVEDGFERAGRCGDWTLYRSPRLPAVSASPCA